MRGGEASEQGQRRGDGFGAGDIERAGWKEKVELGIDVEEDGLHALRANQLRADKL